MRERERDDNFTFHVGNACINRRAVNAIDKERVRQTYTHKTDRRAETETDSGINLSS